MSVYGQRGLIVRIAYLLIALAWWLGTGCGRLHRGRVIVLCYHGVTAGQAARFARQMRHVAGRTVSLNRAARASEPRRGLPQTSLTFDDAFANLLDHALPVLEELHIPATIFAVTGNLGTPPGWEIDAAHPDARKPTMTGEQIRSAARSGLCRIGSHGVTHRRLTNLSPVDASTELTQSKSDLEALLGEPVLDFAFPHGAFDSKLIDAALAAGYRRVLTIDPMTTRTSRESAVVGRWSMSPDAWRIEFVLTAAGAYAWLPAARRVIRRCRIIFRPRGAAPYRRTRLRHHPAHGR
jgi:peptidoglycan/xylan/chitin deacetylase (PgdA/CDA1 family)